MQYIYIYIYIYIAIYWKNMTYYYLEVKYSLKYLMKYLISSYYNSICRLNTVKSWL